ncbi:hypothetical protein QVA66_09535 [Staphylococcus chromogenes]|nr:hypothetical protein [Staphylococcus chromogenes]
MKLHDGRTTQFPFSDAKRIPRKNEKFWRGVADGSQFQVHGNYFLDAKYWNRLRIWEKEEAHAIAVGRSSRSAVLVGRSAAMVLGLPVLSRAKGSALVAELGYPGARKCGGVQRRAHDVKYRDHYLPPAQILEVRGVRVTSPAQTVIDCARFESFESALVVAEGALRRNPKLRDQIELLVAGMRGSPGLPRVRRRLRWASALSESATESRAKAQLIEAGILDTHKVMQNRELLVDGSRYRPDFLIDGWLIVEIDGEEKYFGKYAPPDEALRGERVREVKLQNAGYRVLRFGWAELEHRTMVEEVKKALAADARAGTKKGCHFAPKRQPGFNSSQRLAS